MTALSPISSTLSWMYDNSEIPDPFGYGQRAVDFLRVLKHPKSTLPGKAFDLSPWQERIVRKIYGPRHPDGTRIIKSVIMMLPRGNRKTSLGAALGLLHTIGPENDTNGEAIFAAADRKQARIAYTEALEIINADPRLSGRVQLVDSKNKLRNIKKGAFLEAISADAGTQHGRTPRFALADEIHAWKKRELWDVIKTGLVKTPNSLLMVITTAGRGQENLAFEVIEYARKVQKGDLTDPAMLPILFEPPKEYDWRDEAIWRMVNPGLAYGYPDIEGMRQLAREAENRPGDREAFKNLHLNEWLEKSTDPFVDMEIYDQGSAPFNPLDLAGMRCFIGVDMSSTTDLTAVVACIVDDEDNCFIVPKFFVPSDNLRRRSEVDGVPYIRWAEEGHIIPTMGNVIDYRRVESEIRDLCSLFDVQEIAFDPAYAQQVMGPLSDEGFPVVTLRQGWVTQSPALNELERVILSGRFLHGGHPVLRWNFSNVAIQKDTNNNRVMHKAKSTDRIDGAAASWMAVSRAMGNVTVSAYSQDYITEFASF